MKRARVDSSDVRDVVCQPGAVMSGLSCLFNQALLSDVDVVVAGRTFHLHKLLLQCSPVLRVMLCSDSWNEAGQYKVSVSISLKSALK